MNGFENIVFLQKEYFILLIFVVVIMYIFIKNKQKYTCSFFTDISIIYTQKLKFYNVKIFLYLLCFLLFIMILSYPSIINNEKNIHKNGIDIVVLLDISGSMDAQDLHPSRIEAAKKGLLSFIEKLKTDRLGLIVFAGKPFISLPLTFDYNILKESISSLNTTTINQQQVGLNGTAIGDALLMAKILFKKPKDLSLDEYKKREKVVVLLTDGDANVGIDPGVAAQVLKEEGIKVYAIGIGSQEGGVIHYNVGPFIQEQKIPPLNDNALNNITNMTQGEYFRVSNNQVFEEVFQKLAQLEKNDINIQIIQGYIPVITPLIYVLLFLIFCIICSEFFILHTKH